MHGQVRYKYELGRWIRSRFRMLSGGKGVYMSFPGSLLQDTGCDSFISFNSCIAAMYVNRRNRCSERKSFYVKSLKEMLHLWRASFRSCLVFTCQYTYPAVNLFRYPLCGITDYDGDVMLSRLGYLLLNQREPQTDIIGHSGNHRKQQTHEVKRDSSVANTTSHQTN